MKRKVPFVCAFTVAIMTIVTGTRAQDVPIRRGSRLPISPVVRLDFSSIMQDATSYHFGIRHDAMLLSSQSPANRRVHFDEFFDRYSPKRTLIVNQSAYPIARDLFFDVPRIDLHPSAYSKWLDPIFIGFRF